MPALLDHSTFQEDFARLATVMLNPARHSAANALEHSRLVADRVDCPGGWHANAPLVWFLDEARKRGFLNTELVLDLEGVPGTSSAAEPQDVLERSAGAALVCLQEGQPRLLVIRSRSVGY